MKLTSQRGAALLNALAVIAFTVMFAQVTSLIMSKYKLGSGRNPHGSHVEQKRGRDHLAKQVQMALLNPQLLYLSATFGTNAHPYNPDLFINQANRSFQECLIPGTRPCNVDATDGRDAPFDNGRDAPFNNGGVAGYPFVLIRDSEECQTNPTPDLAGAGPDAKQCIIGGQIGGAAQQVGYNFRGQQGPLSPRFPLEVRVYFNPKCTDKPSEDDEDAPAGTRETELDRNATCDFSRSISVAYQVIHRRFDGGVLLEEPALGRLGIFPRQLTYQTMPTYLITGKKCNDGAFVKGYTRDGNLDCECRTPWKASGQVNAHGPICESPASVCPSGTHVKRRNADGSLECVGLTLEGAGDTNRTFHNWTEELCLSTEWSGCDPHGNSSASCFEEGPPGGPPENVYQGWVTKAEPLCSSRVPLPEQPGDLESDEALRIGLIVAGAIAGAIVAYFTGGGALVWVVGAIFGSVVGDWLGGLFDDRDYHIAPVKPIVICNWQISCRGFAKP